MYAGTLSTEDARLGTFGNFEMCPIFNILDTRWQHKLSIVATRLLIS